MIESPMKISVLILTHNREKELFKCLSSLRPEQDKLFEILVLDNGSEKPLQSSHPEFFSKLKIFRSEMNLGVAQGRNFLAEKAGGDLFWFIDDDALLISQKATREIEIYFKKSDLGVVSFKVINSFTQKEEKRCIPHKRKTATESDCPASYFVGCSFVVRRTAFFEAGAFWEPFTYSCEELDLSYRLITLGYTIIRSSILKVEHAYLPNEVRTKTWIYFNTRNRLWLAVRNLPLTFIVSQSVLWWGYGAWVALQKRQIKSFFSAFFDSLWGVPMALQTRKVISKEVVSQVANLGGRLWY